MGFSNGNRSRLQAPAFQGMQISKEFDGADGPNGLLLSMASSRAMFFWIRCTAHTQQSQSSDATELIETETNKTVMFLFFSLKKLFLFLKHLQNPNIFAKLQLEATIS